LEKLHGGRRKLFNNIEKLLKLKQSQKSLNQSVFCTSQVGDKLVFDLFKSEKSKGGMCPKASSSGHESNRERIWNGHRMGSSGKEKPPEIVWRFIRC